MNRSMRLRLAGAFCVASFLVACGGGGGGGGSTPPAASTVISGTAAAGAPIIGSVTIKDSSVPAKTKVVAIAADGKYSVDAAGLIAPFMLRADGTVGGRSYTLFSAATSADVGGTINVTPLTDLIVANVAGQVAEAVYNSGNFSGMTATELTAATNALRTRLQPVLSAVGLSNSIDLLRASFNTDRTGMDAALDVIRVTQDPVTLTATITNIIDNQQITDNLASKTDATVLNQTNVAAGLSDSQQIVALFDQFTALFATSLPSPTNATLLALFDSSFKDDGQNLAAFLSELTSDPTLVGVKFTNVAFNSLTSTIGQVSFAAQHSGRSEFVSMQVNKVGSAWKIAGNQRIGMAEVHSFARRHPPQAIQFSGAPAFDTGLNLEIKEPSGVADYAIVTGPGLPATGALMVRVNNQQSFKAAAGSTYSGIDSATPSLNNFGHNQFPLSNDALIAGIPDNAVYTIVFKDDNNTVNTMSDDVTMATYTITLAKRPFLNSELGTSLFATITAPTSSQVAAFAAAGGTLTVNWTVPAGALSEEVHFFRNGAGFNDTQSVNVASTATTANVTMSASAGAVQGSGINLFVTDAFGRERVTILQGQ